MLYITHFIQYHIVVFFAEENEKTHFQTSQQKTQKRKRTQKRRRGTQKERTQNFLFLLNWIKLNNLIKKLRN